MYKQDRLLLKIFFSCLRKIKRHSTIRHLHNNHMMIILSVKIQVCIVAGFDGATEYTDPVCTEVVFRVVQVFVSLILPSFLSCLLLIILHECLFTGMMHESIIPTYRSRYMNNYKRYHYDFLRLNNYKRYGKNNRVKISYLISLDLTCT